MALMAALGSVAVSEEAPMLICTQPSAFGPIRGFPLLPMLVPGAAPCTAVQYGLAQYRQLPWTLLLHPMLHPMAMAVPVVAAQYEVAVPMRVIWMPNVDVSRP